MTAPRALSAHPIARARVRVESAVTADENRAKLRVYADEAMDFLLDVMRTGEASEQRAAAMALLTCSVRMDGGVKSTDGADGGAELTTEQRRVRLLAAVEHPEMRAAIEAMYGVQLPEPRRIVDVTGKEGK